MIDRTGKQIAAVAVVALSIAWIYKTNTVKPTPKTAWFYCENLRIGNNILITKAANIEEAMATLEEFAKDMNIPTTYYYGCARLEPNPTEESVYDGEKEEEYEE